MSDTQKWERRVERERLARKEAERLLEDKSAELYEKNLELFSLSESLERLVAERTAQMQKARDDALNALKVKTDFIANMSHELRTPMNGVLGVLGLLQNEALNADQKSLLDVAESSGKHLLEVINDILDFSKIEANKISIELAPLSIKPYFETLIAPFALQAKQKGIQLSCELDEALPASLMTDKLRLTQIATNLLSNAVKFTQEGEVSLRFKALGNDIYRLSVADTGIGISEENLNAVFGAFEQADTSITREFGGTGLGMNITKRLVDMFGGKIAIDSELGKGTCFMVDIKMAKVEVQSTQLGQGASAASNIGEKHLLLVEDHKVNQMVARRLLEHWGFAVTLAENGAQALEHLQQAPSKTHFDGILMDLQMPLMGGVEATKRIRKQGLINVETPIIAMTAHSSQHHINECMAAGMQAHVSKPLDKVILLDVLQTQLNTGIDNKPSASSPVLDTHFRHISINEGLDRVSGDWPVYYRLVSNFLNEFKEFVPVFLQSQADGMDDMAISMLHKLKGSGGNLGMHTLADFAALAETDLKDKGEWPSESEVQAMGDLISEMLEDFENAQGSEPEAARMDKRKVSTGELLAQISLIESALTQDVLAAEEALQEMMSFEVSPAVEAAINKAESAMQAFDTNEVANALTQARQLMD